jgi:hypothetical protein
METYMDENDTIWVRYGGKGDSVLKATAQVEIDYDPNITADRPLQNRSLASTTLTEADETMKLQAGNLAWENSSLKTIRNLVSWVHDYIDYDLTYWGRVRSAKEAFAEKRGVCVEYAHLLIALARSLGFETRYVSGYVYANAWQPHAWNEIYVPDYGWLPADATFGQAGFLDDTHAAIQKGSDQSSAFDTLLSKDAAADLRVDDEITAQFLSSDPKGVSVDVSLDQQTYVADARVTNSRPRYVYGTYTFLVPEGYGGEKSALVLLEPYQTTHFYHAINYSILQNSIFYRIPVYASFNDAHEEKVFAINQPPEEEEPAGPCLAAFLLASFALLAAGRAADA